MTTTPLPDMIVEYSTSRLLYRRELPYREWLAHYHVQYGLGPLPPIGSLGAEVKAYISMGRWIAECDVCKSAVVPESADPWFICPACGSGGIWQPVTFPVARVAIERLLLLRPGFREFAPTRNWKVGETLDDLRKQNIAHGLGT